MTHPDPDEFDLMEGEPDDDAITLQIVLPATNTDEFLHDESRRAQAIEIDARIAQLMQDGEDAEEEDEAAIIAQIDALKLRRLALSAAALEEGLRRRGSARSTIR